MIGRAMNEGATFSFGPLAMCSSVAVIDRWCRSAKPKAKIEFARGVVVPRGESGFIHARELCVRGLIYIHQLRDGRATVYFAIRSALSFEAALASAQAAPRKPRVADDVDRALLALIKEDAAAGLPARSFGGFMRALNLRSRDVPRHRIEALAARGLIRLPIIDGVKRMEVVSDE